MSLLEVHSLTVHYLTARGEVHALDEVSFDLKKGEALGLVGESGCGKTTVAMAIMRLLAHNARILSGRILLRGEDLLQKDEEEMRKVCWKEVSMVFQSAMNALNPVHRVGDQIMEAILAHDGSLSQEEARKRVSELFGLVGLDPKRLRDYPHQYSGGQRQRVAVARAMVMEPDFVVADEPVSMLDASVQAQILNMLLDLKKRYSLTLLFITHDLASARYVSDRLAVNYRGKIMEYGPTEAVIQKPLHPYTRLLIRAAPSAQSRTEIRPIATCPVDLYHTPHS